MAEGRPLTVGQDGDPQFLRLTSSKPDETVPLYRRIDLPSLLARAAKFGSVSGTRAFGPASRIGMTPASLRTLSLLTGRRSSPSPCPFVSRNIRRLDGNSYVAPVPYGAAYF